VHPGEASQSSPRGHRLQRAYTGDGAILFKHACALGCEGIVSKRLGSPYRLGRTDHLGESQESDGTAANRLDEEDRRK
jgi:hypothetical protein